MRKDYSVKAVIFDMDGVITNTMPDHFHAWKEILKTEGISVTRHDIYSREGQRGINSVFELFETYKRPVTDARAHKILKRKEELFKRIVRIRFITGSRRFLRRLHQQKFKLALVTGTSRQELHRILPQPLYDLFDVVVTGSDVMNGKPHPEPYLKAVRQLSLRCRDAVAIENAPFGIRSAKAAGLRCLALETSLSTEYLKQADRIFKTFKEMEAQINFCRN